MEQYYHVDKFTSDRTFFFQTVEPQPQRLIGPNTDADGFYNYNAGGEYHSGTENKLSVYGTDEWKVTDNFNVSYGLHLRNHILDGEYSLTPRTIGFNFTDPAQFDHISQSFFQIAGSLNATYNITKNFGVLANFYTPKKTEDWKVIPRLSNRIPIKLKARWEHSGFSGIPTGFS